MVETKTAFLLSWIRILGPLWIYQNVLPLWVPSLEKFNKRLPSIFSSFRLILNQYQMIRSHLQNWAMGDHKNLLFWPGGRSGSKILSFSMYSFIKWYRKRWFLASTASTDPNLRPQPDQKLRLDKHTLVGIARLFLQHFVPLLFQIPRQPLLRPRE